MNKFLIQTIAIAVTGILPVIGNCSATIGLESPETELIQEKSADNLGFEGVTIRATVESGKPQFKYINPKQDKEEKLIKFRFLLPRDRKFTIENRLNGYTLEVTEKFGDEGASAQQIAKNGERSISASDQVIQIQIKNDDNEVVNSILVELMAAKKLEILTTVGMGATFAPREPESYRLEVDPNIGSTPNTRIVRSDSRSFTANISGQIYAPFDDEAFFGGFGLTLAKIMTLGMFNREHHRLGLMAGIATNGADDPSYQIGYMWSLDREAKMVISVGWIFRQRQDLLFGLSEGDIFSGDIPVRKRWKSSPFIGISFNLGT
ncbi:MAG: hypothetical protein KF824_05990 [Fimbriimonadaceae bacterium]|nr:MAG: hypothetical protein KF824_05990 [Fimbriimonadaceae bacterium]